MTSLIFGKVADFRGENSVALVCSLLSFFFRNEVGSQTIFQLARQRGQRPARGSAVLNSGQGAVQGLWALLGARSSRLASLPPRGPRARWDLAGSMACAQSTKELCLFSSYSWPPSTRLFVAAQLQAELGPWESGGGPFARLHEFYGIGAPRAKLQAKSKCVNYRFVL